MTFRTASLCLTVGLAAAIQGATPAPAAAQDKQPYVIYLSNNFVGNDWRQQMQRVAEVSVNKGPLEGRVDLRIEVAEGTVQAQINSLNNIIRAAARRDPDRRGLRLRAQSDDQARLRRRYRRDQLRPGGDRALRLCARLRLGHDPGGDGRVDGRPARRQGQRHRRPRPRRRADLGAAPGGLREGAGRSIPTSRSSATTTATTRSGRSSPGSQRCSQPIRRSTAC